MKYLSILIVMLSLLSATVGAAAKPEVQSLSVLGFKIGMKSGDMIKILKINGQSKVLVGNTNNPFPKDYDKTVRVINDKYTAMFPHSTPENLKTLIREITKRALNNPNYEVSCSDKICDTSFLKQQKIPYFIARFSDDNQLGNLSMHQKVLGSMSPQKVVTDLMTRYGKTEVQGERKGSKERVLNYVGMNGNNLSIKIITKSDFTMLEYKLFNYSIFTQPVKKVKALVKAFELAQ